MTASRRTCLTLCFAVVTATVLTTGITGSAWAQRGASDDAATLGMGNTHFGIDRGPTDVLGNPGFLPIAGLGTGTTGQLWGVEGSSLISSTGRHDDSVNGWDIALGTRPAAGNWGAGLSYLHSGCGSSSYELGFGYKLQQSVEGFSVGLSLDHSGSSDRRADSESRTTFNLGAVYTPPWPHQQLGFSPFTAGLVVHNVFDQTGNSDRGGRQFDVGASIRLTSNLIATTDERGIGSEDRAWCKGFQYSPNAFSFRVGDQDGKGTYGLGYAPTGSNWKVDLAHTQDNGEKRNLLSFTYDFK